MAAQVAWLGFYSRCSIIHTHDLPHRDARVASSHQHPPLHPDPGAQQHTAWGFSEATSPKRQCAGQGETPLPEFESRLCTDELCDFGQLA